MNKHLKEFAERYSLQKCDENVVSGVINGYQVVVSLSYLNASAFYVKIYSNFDSVQNLVNDYIKNNKKTLKLSKYGLSKRFMTFDFTTFGLKGWVKKAENLILEITNYLKEINAHGVDYCPACGEKIDYPTEVVTNDYKLLLCTKCANNLNETRAKAEEEYQAAPGNYGKGLLGAIVGALIGGIVWVALAYVLGLVSAFIAILITYLAAVGYDKMKGKQNKNKLVITTIVSLVVVVLSMFLSYVVMIDLSLKAEGIEANPIEALLLLLETDVEIMAGFVKDMFMSLLFGVLGTVAYSKTMKKNLHK